MYCRSFSHSLICQINLWFAIQFKKFNLQWNCIMQTIHFVAKLDVTKHETSWTQWSTPFQVQNVFNSKIHSHHVFTVHYKFKSEVKAIIKLLKTGSWKNGCHFLKEISCAIKVLIDLIEQGLISPHNSPIKWSFKLFSWNLASIKLHFNQGHLRWRLFQ